MPLKNSPQGYGVIAKGLHWVSALIVLAMLPFGFYMAGLAPSPFKFDLYWWHKSFGTLVFFLVLARIVWRAVSPPPPAPAGHAPWEKSLARVVHFLLYLGMIGMPVSGIVMSAAADFPRPFFGLFEIPDFIPGRNEALSGAANLVHEIAAFALLIAVGLHGAGAFKHHVIDRDATLLRMLPAAAPRFGFIAAAALFVMLAGGGALLGVRALLFEEDKAPVEALARTGDAGVEIPAMGVALPFAAVPLWKVEPLESRIGFSATVQGAAFSGAFENFNGVIMFDPENLAESRVEMRVETGSVASGSAERDGYIVMPAWFDSAAHPQAVFTATSFEKSGADSYIADGTLTLRGRTLPVELPFTLKIFDPGNGVRRAEMSAAFSINRLDYEIGAGEWADPGTVAPEVTITVELVAVSAVPAEQPAAAE